MDHINKRQLGASKEKEVCSYLEQNGYRIKMLNFRCRYGEIDIVAEDNRTTVFLEVKFRSTIRYGYPEEAVTPLKQKTIRKVARVYMMLYGISYDSDVRFDVVAVLGNDIKLYKNAF